MCWFGIKIFILYSWESDCLELCFNKLVFLVGVFNVSFIWLLVGWGIFLIFDELVVDFDSMCVVLDWI